VNYLAVLLDLAKKYYLTLPAVNPPTKYFSILMKRITTGMIAIAVVVNRYSQATSYCPTKVVIPVEIG
jgi:hypothetical protein